MTTSSLATSQLTAGEAVERVQARLTRAGVPTPETDAEWLVRHATGWSRTEILTRGREPLPHAGAARVDELCARRAAREPLQLILGSVGFRHLEPLVRAGVFIPRPETETLAGEAIERTPRGGVVVEPCTGAGAVACAVAAEAQANRVIATDTSPAAVALARHNAATHGLRVGVRCGDLLTPVAASLRGRVDVLVANPPYVAGAELAGTQPEVREWDPVEALVAGPTGHEVCDRLLAEAPAWLAPGGWLLLEVDERRAGETRARCVSHGLVDPSIVQDAAGRPRVVVARQPVRRL